MEFKSEVCSLGLCWTLGYIKERALCKRQHGSIAFISRPMISSFRLLNQKPLAWWETILHNALLCENPKYCIETIFKEVGVGCKGPVTQRCVARNTSPVFLWHGGCSSLALPCFLHYFQTFIKDQILSTFQRCMGVSLLFPLITFACPVVHAASLHRHTSLFGCCPAFPSRFF